MVPEGFVPVENQDEGRNPIFTDGVNPYQKENTEETDETEDSVGKQE
jgi:hypothetical protein